MQFIRNNVKLIAVAAVCLTAGAIAPAAAGGFASNSHRVDGFHAVAASASVADRAGKLVATDPITGLLPNGIIVTAPNALRLGGQPASAYQGSIAYANVTA